MLNAVAVPLHRLALGQRLPVDVYSGQGRLLLRRGQRLESEEHRQMLAAHHASMNQTDALAWEASLRRSLRNRTPAQAHAPVYLPEDILDSDYLDARPIEGGWLDVQEILRGLLYQGLEAQQPLARLRGIETRVLGLLHHDADEALFVLFQALPELTLGYCATHALLTSTISVLTARKLQTANQDDSLLVSAALTMNIGMARPQDSLARQHHPPNQAQRQLINQHPPTGSDMLRHFGLQDEALLHMIQWHHTPADADLPPAHTQALHILHLADTVVAKLAPRASRPALRALDAAKALMQPAAADSQVQATLRSAMAAVIGFYPPGTYVRLHGGEIGVVIQRGRRAHTPHVASLTTPEGLPLSRYIYRSTEGDRQGPFAVAAPLETSEVNIRVSLDKVRRLRQQQGLTPELMFPLRSVLSGL
jgi:HD-GYP domain-containing protein (c-di-GMP phosphodiesterase class II)